MIRWRGMMVRAVVLNSTHGATGLLHDYLPPAGLRGWPPLCQQTSRRSKECT